jgi:hypothetical protein
MKRDIEKDLLEWKISGLRKPLLVRGARQVGKTYTITKFARENFDQVVIINFDKTPEVHHFFAQDLTSSRILRDLGVYYNVDIVPGKSVLFFDEIQECPRAVAALRYFYEEIPELHVIGAGSLLEFVLRAEHFKMPVGRIDYLWLKPLSFGEFLEAAGHTKLRQWIQEMQVGNVFSEPLHEKLKEILKEYAGVGGMPAIVEAFTKGVSLKQIKELQESLLRTFRDDFGKYASRAHYKYLDKVFLTGPKMAGRKFKYSHVDEICQVRDIKNALELLIEAGLFYKVKHTSSRGLPLEAEASEKKFKVIFFDVGLMQHIAGLEREIHFSGDVTGVHQGSVAEQLAGQELLAYTDKKIEPRLYFWTREERGSSAEVDYLVTVNTSIYPVEVKSASPGRLKSLRLFMKERSTKIGVRLSTLPLSFQDQILSCPLYAIERLQPLIELCLEKNSQNFSTH